MTSSPQFARWGSAAGLMVGLLVAGQSRINAELAAQLAASGSGTTAAGFQTALISFGAGLTMLLIGALLMPRLRAGAKAIVAGVRQQKLRWWHLLGGLGGAWLVATQGLTVPTLGVALFMVAVVAGQTAASLGVDAIGLGPAGRLAVTRYRGIAAALAIAAVALTALPRIEADSGGRTFLLAGLVLTAGAAIAVQQALNARVAVVAESAPAAAGMNFSVGTAALAGVVLGGAVLGGWSFGSLPTEPLLYIGGPIGVLFIAIAAWAVPVVGVLRFALAAIVGQLCGGALMDVLVPQPGVTVGPEVLVGIVLTLIAVVIGNRKP